MYWFTILQFITYYDKKITKPRTKCDENKFCYKHFLRQMWKNVANSIKQSFQVKDALMF
jgi:hypothetical protein